MLVVYYAKLRPCRASPLCFEIRAGQFSHFDPDAVFLVGRTSYEMISGDIPNKILILTRQLPFNQCRRLAHSEWLVGSLSFALELAGDNAVVIGGNSLFHETASLAAVVKGTPHIPRPEVVLT
jgi:dihydrofolate reductase